MPLELPAEQRRALKRRAHALKPVVTIGSAGLTEAVLAEIASSLAHHELMKIRLPAGEHAARTALIEALRTKLDAAPVQEVGFVVTLYRKRKQKAVKKKKAARRTAAKPERPRGKPPWQERRGERRQRGAFVPNKVRN